MESYKDLPWNLYTELRKEIIETQKIRAQIVGFKIAFVSGAVGIIVAHSDKISSMLFALPALASIFFDLLIESNSFSVKRIGVYLRNYIEPALRQSYDFPKEPPLWEEFLCRPETKQKLSALGNLGLTTLTVAIAIFALIRPFQLAASLPMIVILVSMYLYDIYVFIRIGRIRDESF
ncbi:MAG: hypothetical protein HY755_13215 [Nitrospirae bacterium]|nr:hypothetical protein [Nitrospirota bacterium]